MSKLDGLGEVEWGALRHAYGTAERVPELLLGLVSQDAAEREIALDGMYGAVHHQGNVYDSTLACIPFLFRIVGMPEVRDRGAVLALLAGIGGEDREEPDEPDGGEDASTEDRGEGQREGRGGDDDEGAAYWRNVAMARTAVRAGSGTFVELLADDADSEVRREAAKAMAAFHEDPAEVLGRLRERLAVEEDEAVSAALVDALTLLAVRRRGTADEVTALLAELAGSATGVYGPRLRLAALTGMARHAPDLLPDDLAGVALDLARRVRELPAPEPEPRPVTNTLVGRLRELMPQEGAAAPVLRGLHTALGGHVERREALLAAQLAADVPAERLWGVRWLSSFFREWRGSFPRLLELAGGQLEAGDGQMAEEAASVLETLFELAAPEADRLAAYVAATPGSWVKTFASGPPVLGCGLRALLRVGDVRAVPALEEVLRQPLLPRSLGAEVARLGSAAGELVPSARERLAAVDLAGEYGMEEVVSLAGVLACAPDDGGEFEGTARVLREVLDCLPPGVRQRDWAARTCLRALAARGPGAAGSVGGLADLHADAWPVDAAATVWAVHGDAEAVLPTLLGELRSDRSGTRREAAAAVARLGAAGEPAVPLLRAMAEREDIWERLAGITAWWAVAPDAGPSPAALRDIWIANAHTRTAIADCLTRMGHLAADFDLALLRAEVADPRRAPFREGHWGSHDVHDDEALLRACRAALSATTAEPLPR